MNSKTAQHYHNTLVRLSIVALLLMVFHLPIHADVFHSTSSYRVDARPMEATQVAPTTQYQTYESTIYEPFDNNGPSKIGGRRNTGGDDDWSGGDVDLGGWGDETDIEDPGNQSEQSPIGEAWVMLLFAAAAAIVVYRKRISAQKNS